MPSQRYYHDAEMADIDFTRAPSYSSVQTTDREQVEQQFRIGSSVRSGVEYSVGESDASLLSRDTRNAHVHVHTLEKGVGGSGAAISTTKSHTIMFGGAREPSPGREGLSLIAGPEPPSALEGLGKIFSRSSRVGDNQQWRHPGQQQQQQQQQQTMSKTVHSRAVVQYESNGTVRDYEGSASGSIDGSTTRVGRVASASSQTGISSNLPRGGVASDPSPQTKRYLCAPPDVCCYLDFSSSRLNQQDVDFRLGTKEACTQRKLTGKVKACGTWPLTCFLCAWALQRGCVWHLTRLNGVVCMSHVFFLLSLWGVHVMMRPPFLPLFLRSCKELTPCPLFQPYK